MITFCTSRLDRPVLLVGSGRCGSTLLQAVLNTNPELLIWGEHNGFLQANCRRILRCRASAISRQAGTLGRSGSRSRNCAIAVAGPPGTISAGEEEFRERFRAFIRSLFADPTGRATRWGFKEIRYARTADDRTLQLMFDCFPEIRLIVLIREPEPTILSALSRWVFADQRSGNIGVDVLDQHILAAADAWQVQYMHLQFSRANPRSQLPAAAL